MGDNSGRQETVNGGCERGEEELAMLTACRQLTIVLLMLLTGRSDLFAPTNRIDGQESVLATTMLLA